jgi:hypothetical protein
MGMFQENIFTCPSFITTPIYIFRKVKVLLIYIILLTSRDREMDACAGFEIKGGLENVIWQSSNVWNRLDMLTT